MKITILGTGVVGRTLAAPLADKGHEVVIGTRDPQATLARTEPDHMGNPPYTTWQAEHPAVRLLAYPEAAVAADLVINATSGEGSLEALRLVGAETLAGKILIDVANPLDFSNGFPPTLSVKDTDSLAEQIQRAFPETKVVKALNTLNSVLMLDPTALADGDHTLFVSGNDSDAKATVTELLRSFGWQDVIDLGDISTARGTEMLLPIWLRLLNTLGTPAFNFKIVR